MPDVSDLVKKTDFNAKITEVENKIPSITGLVKKRTLILELVKWKTKYLILVA